MEATGAARVSRPSALLAVVYVACFALASPVRASEVHRPAPGRDLQAVLDASADGDVIELGTGSWRGPLVVTRSITLRAGPGARAVIDGGLVGTVLRVEAPNVRIEGLRVERSGDDLSGPDACIYLAKTAAGAVVTGNHVVATGFGVWLHQVVGAEITGNRVVGTLEGHRSMRGNGIQLFDSDGLLVARNVVTGGRDGIYVSATENSRILDNELSGTRYGIHYMYSYDNTLTGNRAHDNGSGIALMGSRRLTVTRNDCRHNEDHGLLLRDVQYTVVEGNHLEANGEGLFMYSSTDNTLRDNRIVANAVGAKVWAGSKRNVVTGNVFAGNRQQVFYVSTQDLVWGDPTAEGTVAAGDHPDVESARTHASPAAHQPGNLWSDYLGWDQDGDGIGDRPYRVDSFSTQLVHQYPAAALLMRSPALELLTHLQERMPVLRVATVVDVRPLMRRAAPLTGGARP